MKFNKITEDMKIKMTLGIFLFSLGRLIYAFDSPEPVGDFLRTEVGLIKDKTSVYDIIVAKPMAQQPTEEATEVVAESTTDEPGNVVEVEKSTSDEADENPDSKQSLTADSEGRDGLPEEIPPEPKALSFTEDVEPEIEEPMAQAKTVRVTVSRELQTKILGLMTCKNKNPASEVHPLIWSLIVKKTGLDGIVTRKPSSLPEISREFFGEEECWPKLWSLNPDIQNPYNIPEGAQLNFLNKQPGI